MSNVLSKVMLAAAQASYTTNGSVVHPLPAGYALDADFDGDGLFEVPDTGFKVIAMKNTTTGEVILAFTGTEDSQDWFQHRRAGQRSVTRRPPPVLLGAIRCAIAPYPLTTK